MNKPIIEELEKPELPRPLKAKTVQFIKKAFVAFGQFILLSGISILLFNLAANGPISSW